MTTAAFFSDFFGDVKLDSKIARSAAEAAWLAGLVPREAPLRVLDLGCGRGRVAIELARLGHDVTGLDVSESYLDVARRRSAELGLDVRWVRGDDRLLDDVEAYDLAVSMFTSFGFHGDDDNALVARNVARALAPGGVFVIETQNRDHPGMLVPGAAVEALPDGTELLKTYDFDVLTSRKRITFRYLRDGRVEPGGRLDVRMYSVHELVGLLRANGFGDVTLYGSSRGAPFETLGEKLVVAARKAPA